jgi:hypothetical protein
MTMPLWIRNIGCIQCFTDEGHKAAQGETLVSSKSQ